MGIQFSDDVTFPESTGAVVTPSDEVTTEAVPGHPTSTDAVVPVSGPVTTEFGPSGQEPTGTVATPGPVKFENPSVKVVRPSGRRSAESETTAETKTPTGSVRTQQAQGQSPHDGR